MCKMFDLNPQGTVKLNNVTVPVILCHADSYKLGLGNNHGDVYNWFKKFGKTMQDVRNDVEKLLKETSTPAPAPAPAFTTTSNPTVVVTPTLIGATDEEKIWNYLLNEINNEYGVAGLMGNIKAESSFKPTNLQNSYEASLGYTDDSYTKAVDSGKYSKEQFVNDKAGYGLAQWTYWSRKQKLYEYMKSKNYSIGDLRGQLEFLVKEIQGYKIVWTTLLSAKSIFEASTIVVTQYEKPASKDSKETQNKRASYGEAVYAKFAKKATVQPAPTPTPGKTSESTPIPGSTPVVTTPEAKTTTNVRMGHASISENNTISGVAGDQTKKEVLIRAWYNKPWDFIAIHPDPIVREKMAIAIEAGCANDKIGYDQSSRNTLNTQAKAVGYDLSKIAKACNTDCSAFMNVCAVASGAPSVTYSSNGWTTSNMKSKLQSAGYKIITDSTLISDKKYCVRGAIYVKTKSHAAGGLDNGTEYEKMLNAANISQTSVNNSYLGKGIGTAVAQMRMNVRSNNSTSSSIYDSIPKGTIVEVLEIMSNGWYKIVWAQAPQGYAYTSNSTGDYYSYQEIEKKVEKSTSTQKQKSTSSITSITASRAAKNKNASLAGKYAVTASSLNVRDGAGTKYAILTQVAEGTLMSCYGYYTSAEGDKWLYVQFIQNGITYTGFVSSKYIEKKV